MESINKVTEIEPLESALSGLRRMPSEFYFLAVGTSILVSLLMFMSGRRWASLFFGLWPPTILAFGLYNKVVGPSRPVR
ncbi:MAG: hypothetical protein HYX94_14190 [Chloroflexi bacterium]|nr:hypothetical protein [Chloroflexota bacterium]